jgi:hypothetical protein
VSFSVSYCLLAGSGPSLLNCIRCCFPFNTSYHWYRRVRRVPPHRRVCCGIECLLVALAGRISVLEPQPVSECSLSLLVAISSECIVQC